jgi:hypothetical protein
MIDIPVSYMLYDFYIPKIAHAVSPDHAYCWLSAAEDGLMIMDGGIYAGRIYRFHSELGSEHTHMGCTPVALSIAQKMSQYLPIGENAEVCFVFSEETIFVCGVGKHVVLSIWSPGEAEYDEMHEKLEGFALDLLEFFAAANRFHD